MASSLGTLTLDLIAKVGGFTGPLDKASKEAKKRAAEIRKSAEEIGKGLGVGIAAVAGAVTALTISSVKAGGEIVKFAQVSGSSTTEFQKMSFGAKAVGIEQDKLADIFKDVNDKVGDFLSTGGGELQNFFSDIAPKVGVTAEQFRDLSGPEALGLFASSLEKAGVSQAQFTFYMESIANDATLLIPLLKNGGEGFRKFGELAEQAGAVMSDKTIKATQELSASLMIAEASTAGLKNQIAASLLPVIADFAASLSDTSVNGATASQVADTLTGSMKVLAGVALGVVGAFELTGKAVGGFVALSSKAFNGVNWKDIALGPVGVGYAMSKNLKGVKDLAVDVGDDLETTAKKYEKFFDSVINAGSGQSGSKSKELADMLAQLRQGSGGKGTEPAQTAAQKAAEKAAAAAAKKIQDAFKTTETDYRRQIELINTTTDAQEDATEADKLHFEIASGKLVGINAEQQKRLEGLASELDRLDKLKKSNEDLAAVEAYRRNANQENQQIKDSFDLDLAGAGQGDKAKARRKQFLQIDQDYFSEVDKLWQQLNSKDITKDRYQQETDIAKEAYAERIIDQQDYYNQVDEAQSQWMDGVHAAWQNYSDAAQDYTQLSADLTSRTLNNASGSLSTFLSDVATGSQDAGDALGDMIAGFAKSTINALADLASQWLVYQAVQLVVGKTAQSSAAIGIIANAQAASFLAQVNAYASTAAIPVFGPALAPGAAFAAAAATAPMVAGVASAALSGMAHDGIDSVPETGTWLLQKGERVTTAETSAKLDKTLSQMQVGGSGGQVVIHAPVTVQAQPGMSGADAQAQGQAISDALDQKITKSLQRELRQGGLLWNRMG